MFAAHNAIFSSAAPKTPVSIKGTAANFSTSCTLPSHALGDLIVVWAADTSVAATISVPSGWTSITSKGGSVFAYKFATSGSEVSGTWGNAEVVTAAVMSGTKATSPIGGVAAANRYFAQRATDVSAPAITLSKSDGTSAILHYVVSVEANGQPLYLGALASGYTMKTQIGGDYSSYRTVKIASKDVTTSDGAASFGSIFFPVGDWSTTVTGSIEVLA